MEKSAAIEKVNIKINGREYAVPSGITILEAARICRYRNSHALLFEGYQ